MRNLKRALSLTLASVMLLGMMVIGTSAASFTDADQITNTTAATILQELEIMQGNNGKFNPTGTVTRGQMAIIICKIMYGNRLNVDTIAQEQKFDDCPAGAYYTGYVNFAAEQGIISGYGNGKFGPGAPVSTAQAALMLCRALGYYQGGELEGQSWAQNALNATALATKLRLFGDLKLDTNAGLSRDNVAEMVFNTMTKTVPVMYNPTWNLYYTDSANVLGGTKFNYVNTLGFTNYNLVYVESKDSLGRTVTTWGTGTVDTAINGGYVDAQGNLKTGAANLAKKDEIISVTTGPVATYTSNKNTTGGKSDITRDMRGYDLPNSSTVITVNGHENTATTPTVDIIAALTADGATVTVFADNDNKITRISVVREELAKVVSINSVNNKITLATDDGSKVLGDDHDAYDKLVGRVQPNDYVVVVMNRQAGTDGVDTVTGAAATVADAYVGKSVSGNITGHNQDFGMIMDGKTYKRSIYAANNGGSGLRDPNSFTTTEAFDATLYLNTNGEVIGVDSSVKIGGEQVCYVAYAKAVGTWNDSYEAYVYLPDGTKGAYKVASLNGKTGKSDISAIADSDNFGLYVYTLEDNTISLKAAGSDLLAGTDYAIATNTGTTVPLDKDKANYPINSTIGTVYMNSSTKFYMLDTTKYGAASNGTAYTDVNENNVANSGLITASTGLSSIKLADGAPIAAGDMQVAYRTAANKTKIAVAVFAKYAGSVSTASTDLVYVVNNKYETVAGDKYSIQVYFTGDKEPRPITVKERKPIGLYAYSKDSKDVYELKDPDTCAYVGQFTRPDDDNGTLLFVGEKQLNNLSDANTVVIDCTDNGKPGQSFTSYLTNERMLGGWAVADDKDNVLAVYITGEVDAHVSAASLGTNANPAAALAKLTVGSVVTGSQSDMKNAFYNGTGTTFAPGDSIAIVFDSGTAATAKKVNLTIKDSTGRTVYSDELASVTWTAHEKKAMYVSLDGLCGWDTGSTEFPETTLPGGGYYKFPWGTIYGGSGGTGTQTAGEIAANGIYTYTVTDVTNTETLGSGSFVVSR